MVLENQTLTLPFAFVLGALHALEPGHGKTAMMAFMLSGRRNIGHAIIIGVGNAFSHSISIFLIAGLTHLASHVLTQGHLEESPFTRPLEWVSALLILAIGIYLLMDAVGGRERQERCCARPVHGGNSLRLSGRPTLRSRPALAGLHQMRFSPKVQERSHGKFSGYRMAALLGLGGGLMPCPSALAAFLSSLASGQAAKAFTMITVFSAGAATSLIIAGAGLQQIGGRLAKASISPTRQKLLHCLRALLILMVGVFYIIKLLGS